MKLGLFGGSFDPIHIGHVKSVQEARRQLSLDRVLFLPTAQPPHKPQRCAPPLARFAMVEFALLEEDGCFVSAHELTPERPAYTIDTIIHFRDHGPADELFLILGADSFFSFHTWRRWQEIAQIAELVVLTRDGWSADDLPAEAPDELRRLAAGKRVHWVANPPLDFSSTELRRLLANDGAPAGALPNLVRKYISKYALYR